MNPVSLLPHLVCSNYRHRQAEEIQSSRLTPNEGIPEIFARSSPNSTRIKDCRIFTPKQKRTTMPFSVKCPKMFPFALTGGHGLQGNNIA
jgi:hypothetical protein